MSDSMARVVAALEQLGAEYEPPRGWEARVFDKIEQSPPWWRRWPWMLAIPMGTLGTVASTVALVPQFSPRAALVAEMSLPASVAVASSNGLALGVIRTPVGSATRHRAATTEDSAIVGDRIHVTATSGDRYRAIWVYYNDRELIAACPAAPACHDTRGSMTVDVTLETVGPYIFLAVASSSPLPEPRGSFDLDRAAAEEAGATTQVRRLEAF